MVANQILKSPNRVECSNLFDFDLGADFFELLLDGGGLVLRHAFLDGLGRAFDEVLRFLETQGGDFADDLDDVDLVPADFGQRDGEFGLLFGWRRCGAARPAPAIAIMGIAAAATRRAPTRAS